MLRNSAFGLVKFWTHANTTKKHKFFFFFKYIYAYFGVGVFYFILYRYNKLSELLM